MSFIYGDKMPDYKVIKGGELVAQFSNKKKAEQYAKRKGCVVVSYNARDTDLADRLLIYAESVDPFEYTDSEYDEDAAIEDVSDPDRLSGVIDAIEEDGLDEMSDHEIWNLYGFDRDFRTRLLIDLREHLGYLNGW